MADDNDALMGELRRRLDAQAARQEELIAELRRLRGTDRVKAEPSAGHAALNDELRAAGSRSTPAPVEGQDGPATMTNAIRAAAGRPPLEGRGRA